MYNKKQFKMKKSILTVATAFFISSIMFAQMRPTDQTGINVFETPKTETEFNGLKIDIGGAFSQPYMALSQSNSSSGLPYNANSTNTLFPVAHNFSLAMANLYLNTYLADGVTLNFTLYLASKHHNETWVKGGFIQFDKLPFIKLDLLDDIMKFTTIKMGAMEVNYGDAHYRRSDGGNAIYNPFMENYIMDEFATEVGAEADFHIKDFIAVAAITDGELNGNLQQIDLTKNPASNGSHNPAFVGKLGYDKQLDEKLRVRISGSAYYTAGSVSNTLFGGDRTGSNYSGVMYVAGPGTTTAFNGRYNPGLSDKLLTGMGNLFIKYTPIEGLSLESFSTLEQAKGRNTTELKERIANQVATDLVVRFGKHENFFVGVRYNKVSADAAATAAIAAIAAKPAVVDPVLGVTALAVKAVPGVAAIPAYTAGINRLAVSAGWFVTKNILAKVEYVNQTYSGFPTANIYDGAEFHGLTAEAAIAF
jgi:hypothetical protein